MAAIPQIRFQPGWLHTQSEPLRPGPLTVSYDPARLEELAPGERPVGLTAHVDFGEFGLQTHRWESLGGAEPVTHPFEVPEGAREAKLWFTEETRAADGTAQEHSDSALDADYHFRVAPSHPDPAGYETVEYVRRPGGEQDPEKLPKLIRGAKKAVQETYDPWLHQPIGLDVEAYKGMLQRMHSTMVGEGYEGHLEHVSADWRKPEPGKWFLSVDGRNPIVFDMPLDVVPDPKRFNFHPGKYTVEHVVEGILERNPPQNRAARKRGYLSHVYRDASALKLYLARAAELDLGLRQAIAEHRPADALVILSKYFHTSINGHYFKSVNNSLLMAQVNHALHELGMVGIPAESLDYIALTNGEAEAPGSTRFRDFFLDAVAARNPDAAELVAKARALP